MYGDGTFESHMLVEVKLTSENKILRKYTYTFKVTNIMVKNKRRK